MTAREDIVGLSPSETVMRLGVATAIIQLGEDPKIAKVAGVNTRMHSPGEEVDAETGARAGTLTGLL